MLYIIIITTNCNQNCRYCGGKIEAMPETIQYHLTDLKKFITHDPHPIIAFYGGEPLLQPKTIHTIIQTIPAEHYIINTNGHNIHTLQPHLQKFSTILLSIDGRPTTTDYYRGTGCTQQILNALTYLKTHNYKGELIARMTVSQQSDIYQEVTYLLTHFPLIHWQLDVIWSNQWTLPDFQTWTETSYKPGIKKLINHFNSHLENNTLLGIIPFLGIITRILHGGNGLPCQSGNGSYTIATDGRILACPIAPEFSWNTLGTMPHYTPISIGEPCLSCDCYNECGGRCLFFQKEHLWGQQGFNSVCDTTKYLITQLKKHTNLYIQYEDLFHYPPYNNTTEIIP